MSGVRAPLNIELGYPNKALWPNGRAHHMVVARYKKAARWEAGWATKSVRPFDWAPVAVPIPIHLTFYPMPAGPLPDRDNAVAACKAFLDGIADALEVNDRDFEAPTVEFADRCKGGKLIVSIG